MKGCIAFDFSGTLVKREIVEEAGIFRSRILEKDIPGIEKHKDSKVLYLHNREYVEKLTGIEGGMFVEFTQPDREQITISGSDMQNFIATNLFQIGMFIIAKKHRENIFYPGMLDAIKLLKDEGYKIAIYSGVRTDIISGMLSIAKADGLFDHIIGQPPTLGIGNQELIEELSSRVKVRYIVGDKRSDIDIVTKARKIFVDWGHSTGGEEEIADNVVSDPQGIVDAIVKNE